MTVETIAIAIFVQKSMTPNRTFTYYLIEQSRNVKYGTVWEHKIIRVSCPNFKLYLVTARQYW